MRKIEMLNAPHALDIVQKFMKAKNGKTPRGFHRQEPFKALIGTMLSLRARGATVERVETTLFKEASTPQQILDMPVETLVGLLRPLGHTSRRAHFIRETCSQLLARFGGKVPDNMDDLLSLPGVGRKTANLTLDSGFGQTTMTVDTHVHRIMNLWGYVKTKNANETEMVLREKLPRKYWKWFNPLLVEFGNQVCWPASPKCSLCPLDAICPKVGKPTSRNLDASDMKKAMRPRRSAA